MTKTHTPGPWVVKQWNDNDNDIVGFSVVDAEGYTLPTSELDGEANEAEANARLIAACPDMLAALKEIAKGTYDTWSEGYRAQQIAIAALTKATGETP